MAHDHFSVLGLTRRRHSQPEVSKRYRAQRDRLLSELEDPVLHPDSRRRLEELHLAYATLRDPWRQEEYLRAQHAKDDPVGAICALIAASLEGGLLRYSRRQRIIQRARELGLNEFHTQLLIAQVQFGEEHVPATVTRAVPPARSGDPRMWARLAGVGMLALAMFLFLLRWLGG